MGLDLAVDAIPVSPAAHYVMGGVETDLDARTSIAGLLAAGEVACTGVHGANRLASNSLLEGLVFGARAAAAMTGAPRAALLRPCDLTEWPAPRGSGEALPEAAMVREVMWRHAGLLRQRRSLETAVAQLEAWAGAVSAAPAAQQRAHDFQRVRSLVTVGLLIARAALRRQESRGGHFRTDFPSHDDLHWRKHVSDVRSPGSGLRTTDSGARSL